MTINSELIYSGAKKFEKFQKKIDILLVNHEGLSCIEMIVLGIRSGSKISRLYLNSAALVTMINIEHFNHTLDMKQNSAQKLNILYNPGLEMKKLALSIITTVLVECLRIVPSVYVSEFDLCFELNGRRSYLEENIGFEFAIKPHGLIPFPVALPVIDVTT
jgi:hypothetical protein